MQTPVTVLLGTQWGDEGKGKVVDRLSSQVAAVCRYQGGHNAGHTLVNGDQRLVLHITPAGALYPDVLCAIGKGAVVSPASLLQELEQLEQWDINLRQRLVIDPRCHLVLPSHGLLDSASDGSRSGRGRPAIGTTGKGIGPTYEDRAGRRGLRAGDLSQPARLSERVSYLTDRHNFLLRERYDTAPVDASEQLDLLLSQAEQLLPLVADVPEALLRVIAGGDQVLMEGAQGYLLDVDAGTYPFVTSSNTSAANALVGSGLPPVFPLRVLGLAKAYSTRVGDGPFPTELMDETGERLRTLGDEHGATTGRPRRCGWLDTVLLRRAVRDNAVAGLIVSKMDVLDGWDEIRIATGYGRTDDGGWPLGEDDIEWETLPGWDKPVAGCTQVENLPVGARRYLERMEELAGAPVVALSTGPERAHWVEFTDPLEISHSAAQYMDGIQS